MGETASPSSVRGYLPNAREEDQGFRRLPAHLGLTSLSLLLEFALALARTEREVGRWNRDLDA